MHFTTAFTLLLNGILVAFSIPADVQAVPTQQPLNASPVEYDILDISNITEYVCEPRSVPLLAYQVLGQDAGYAMAIKLGTQPQITSMLVDTGSSTFWVVSETSPQKGNKPGFGPGSSTTFKDLKRPWEITYGDESTVKGTVAQDSVKVSSLEPIEDFVIGIGEELTGKTASSKLAGVAGFSNGKIGGPSRTGGITLLEALTEAKLIPQNVVGITLGRGANGAAGRGHITLGGSDPEKYQTGAENLVKVRNRGATGLWQLSLASTKVGGKLARTTRNAILDTGNNRILTSNGDAEFLHLFPGGFKTEDGIFGLPCDPTKIPTISFTVGSVEFEINPIDIIGPKIEVGTGEFCLSNIQNSKKAMWSLGIPFMKSVYQILDTDANEITLAKLK